MYDDQSHHDSMQDYRHMNSVNRSRNQPFNTTSSSSLSNALADPGTYCDECWLKLSLTCGWILGSGNRWPPYSNSRVPAMDHSGYQNVPSTSSSVVPQQYGQNMGMGVVPGQYAPPASSGHPDAGLGVGQRQWMQGPPNPGTLQYIQFLRNTLKLSQALLTGPQLLRSSTYPTWIPLTLTRRSLGQVKEPSLALAAIPCRRMLQTQPHRTFLKYQVRETCKVSR